MSKGKLVVSLVDSVPAMSETFHDDACLILARSLSDTQHRMSLLAGAYENFFLDMEDDINAKEYFIVNFNASARSIFDMLSVCMTEDLRLLRYNLDNGDDEIPVTVVSEADGFEMQATEGLPDFEVARIEALVRLHVHNRLLDMVILACAKRLSICFEYTPS